jgi:hypothetical protein
MTALQVQGKAREEHEVALKNCDVPTSDAIFQGVTPEG